MYCPDCGHNNPEDNRFCGMCGERLPERRAPKTGAEIRADQRERIAQHDPEPVAASLRKREPIDEPVRELPTPAVLPSRPSSPKATSVSPYGMEPSTEPTTTLSGPSFLGLNSGSNGSESYSYLYEDEAPKSHAGFLAFVLFLVVLGGVVYWQWQPIQNWVINRANQKVDTGTPAPTAGSSTASSDNTSTPPSQAGQPANSTAPGGNSGAAPSAQTPNQTTPSNQRPNATPDSSATPKSAQPDNKPKDDDKAAPPENQDESNTVETTPRESKARKTAGATRTDAARRQTAPEPPAGADLVASGEKYLYGRGVPQNCGHAVNDFNNAAQQDNPRAMAHLGALFATGECVPLNRVRAYQWFSRALAKDRSNTYLEHNMSMLWREMDANEKSQVSGQAETARSKMF